MKIYKIRNKNTGLFSSGGYDIRWSKRGKIWKQKNHVGAHISQFKHTPTYGGTLFEDCEIVEYIVSETEVNILPLKEK